MRVTKVAVTLITGDQVTGVTGQGVMYDTTIVALCASHELWQAQRVRSGRAGSAMKRILDDQRLGDLAAPIDLEDVWMVSGVVLADPPAAETADAHSGPPTMPTVHE
ncbi:MAG TPA: hypothetical protein VGL18_13520 [Actinomycetota bacterium]|jgi:hypothetical protein